MIGVGDKVVCIKNGPWVGTRQGNTDPIKHEVVTVAKKLVFDKELFYVLKEYHPRDGYLATEFRKLHDDTVENILKLIAERPVTIS